MACSRKDYLLKKKWAMIVGSRLFIERDVVMAKKTRDIGPHSQWVMGIKYMWEGNFSMVVLH